MLTTVHAQTAYARSMVNTSAPPLDLIIVLYKGAGGYLQRAIFYINQRDVPKKSHYLMCALDIIQELPASLDRNGGGEIAERLEALYVYMLRQFTVASARNEVDLIQEIDAC